MTKLYCKVRRQLENQATVKDQRTAVCKNCNLKTNPKFVRCGSCGKDWRFKK